MSNTQKPRGLRAALKNRHVRKSFYDIPQVDHEVAEKAAQELVLCKNTVKAGEYLLSRDQSDDTKNAVEQAKKEVEAAEERVRACFFRVWFVGLPEDDFEALVQANPPTDEQVKRAQDRGSDVPTWNESVFPYELLEHCAQESDLTAEQWRNELAGWTMAERREIVARVLECNLRSYSSTLSFE